jgi:hypothetical protein
VKADGSKWRFWNVEHIQKNSIYLYAKTENQVCDFVFYDYHSGYAGNAGRVGSFAAYFGGAYAGAYGNQQAVQLYCTDVSHYYCERLCCTDGVGFDCNIYIQECIFGSAIQNTNQVPVKLQA